MEEWLPAVESKVRASTWANYRTQVHVHLVPALGATELQRLSPTQLDAFYRCCSPADAAMAAGLRRSR